MLFIANISINKIGCLRIVGALIPSPNNILPTPFLASFRPNPSNQDRSYLRFDGLRQYGYVIRNA